MKKLLLLFIATSLSFSCSSNDDKLPTEPEETKDPIIGVWKLIQRNGQDIADACAKKDTYTFNEDASFTFDDYNTNSGACAKDDIASFRGTWRNNNNNTFNFKEHGVTGNGADVNVSFSTDNKQLTFANNGLTYQKQ